MNDPVRAEKVRRLLQLLYREEVKAAAYDVYRRRARGAELRRMLGTFDRVERRLLGRIEQHLRALGYGGRGRPAPVRRTLTLFGRALGALTAARGDGAILRRLRSEESRGAERYGHEADWDGWSEEERDTVDGHHCDQLYQNQWVQEVERDFAEGITERPRPDGATPPDGAADRTLDPAAPDRGSPPAETPPAHR